ncbi:GNAT family N-acetyltransferase [Arthrobacter sp.]|uniref:GNAT family N-acetyltransferase n=1 Tax=Arthrobacter sp. TaxID=1667 RepID=UPI0026E044FB|nr:N-acetyltransferase [Arthrobacter sp.]MDO5753971.1 N-acetyltransferase [Arthrobacter sp.]
MRVNTSQESDCFDANVRMVRNDARHRYELFAADELAVVMTFQDLPGHTDIVASQALPGFEDGGLPMVLARYALDDVVAAGKRIIPHCNYVRRFIADHLDLYTQYTDFPQEA